MLLFYIRHGEPIYDPDSLTPQGELQARALAKRLAQYGLDAVYASTSNRAKLTAKPTADLLGLPVIEMDWCNEAHAWMETTWVDSTGHREWIWTQKELSDLLLSPEMRALDRRWYEHPFFEGWNYKKGIERIRTEADAWLDGLGYTHDYDRCRYFCKEHNEKRVALFAHQGFGLAFLSCVLDIPYPQFVTHFDLGHSSMTVIRFDENPGWCTPRTLQLSNDSHLFREGLPTVYQNQFRF